MVKALFTTVTADYPQEKLEHHDGGDTMFWRLARWDFASGAEISGAHNLTLDWSAGAAMANEPITIGPMCRASL